MPVVAMLCKRAFCACTFVPGTSDRLVCHAPADDRGNSVVRENDDNSEDSNVFSAVVYNMLPAGTVNDPMLTSVGGRSGTIVPMMIHPGRSSRMFEILTWLVVEVVANIVSLVVMAAERLVAATLNALTFVALSVGTVIEDVTFRLSTVRFVISRLVTLNTSV